MFAHYYFSYLSYRKPHLGKQNSVHSYEEIKHEHFSSHCFAQMHPKFILRQKSEQPQSIRQSFPVFVQEQSGLAWHEP